MKDLDFNPFKSTTDFKNNYKLHDLAEQHGKNLLTQWGVNFKVFGDDKRHSRMWEKGEDKPDLFIYLQNKPILLDWKSKTKTKWMLNKRAYDSYCKWAKKLSTKVIVAFFVFEKKGDQNLLDRRFAVVGKHKIIETKETQWDKNITVEFENQLPEFTKANLIKLLQHE